MVKEVYSTKNSIPIDVESMYLSSFDIIRHRINYYSDYDSTKVIKKIKVEQVVEETYDFSTFIDGIKRVQTEIDSITDAETRALLPSMRVLFDNITTCI